MMNLKKTLVLLLALLLCALALPALAAEDDSTCTVTGSAHLYNDASKCTACTHECTHSEKTEEEKAGSLKSTGANNAQKHDATVDI